MQQRMPVDSSLAVGVDLEVEVQTALLKGVILHKPVGLNRHFKLMLIKRYSVILSWGEGGTSVLRMPMAF